MSRTDEPGRALDPVAIDRLCQAATSVVSRAYARYSHFYVGAAILTEDDDIYCGVNVENATFGATVCAERIALGSALTGGHKDGILALAIASDSKDSDFSGRPLVPCGICLQWIAELAPKAAIIACVDNSRQLYRLHRFLRRAIRLFRLLTTTALPDPERTDGRLAAFLTGGKGNVRNGTIPEPQ